VAEIAAREHLFSTDARAALEPAPYKVTYHYRRADLGCAGHAQGVIDWEAGAAARHWRMKGYPEDELPDRLRNKFFTQMCASDRDTYFFLGNQEKRPRVFMVLGVFWPPAGTRPNPMLF
jgi:hypothetical protein